MAERCPAAEHGASTALAPGLWGRRDARRPEGPSTERCGAAPLDWLGFLYNLTALGADPLPMTGLWNIYRNTCVPPGTPPNPSPLKCTEEVPMQWQLTAVASDPPVACTPGVPTCGGNFTSCLDATFGSMEPCPAGGACVCKSVRQGFVEGARGTFGEMSQQAISVENLGLTFGVDRNLAP